MMDSSEPTDDGVNGMGIKGLKGVGGPGCGEYASCGEYPSEVAGDSAK